MRSNGLLKKLIFISLISCLFIGPASAATKPELIFILAGQSNMLGQAKRAKLPGSYRRNPRNVSFYYNGYKTPLNHFAHFGPEIGFAHEISKRYPKHNIKLIKFAVGGTSMLAWSPNWSAQRANLTKNASAGPLFKKLLQTVNANYDDKASRISAVLWMQGEADAQYPAVARQYKHNLRAFVVALRRQLDGRPTQFIIAGVNPPLKQFPASEVVWLAQKQVASSLPNMSFIATADLTKRSDQLHYDALGQLKLGQRFARMVRP
jgi:hypothetical protein